MSQIHSLIVRQYPQVSLQLQRRKIEQDCEHIGPTTLDRPNHHPARPLGENSAESECYVQSSTATPAHGAADARQLEQQRRQAISQYESMPEALTAMRQNLYEQIVCLDRLLSE